MKQPVGEVFDGRASQMRASPWLSAEDIMGLGDVEVEIENVFFYKDTEFDEGRKEDVYAVKFKGKKAQLVLNATNRKSLVARFTVDTKKWREQKIKLYVVTVNAFGKQAAGIRIR